MPHEEKKRLRMSENTTQEFGGAPITVNAQYIKDLSFENPEPLKVFGLKKEPEISFNVNVQGNGVGEKAFEVELTCQVEAKHEDQRVFLIELNYAGIFTIESKDEDEIRWHIMVDCPRLLFPFARAIITHTTQEAGMGPLYLPLVDFSKLVEKEETENATEKTTIN